jgi:hypothetical protein
VDSRGDDVIKINIGTVKIWFRRTRENVSVLQTAAILYLFVSKAGWKWWYLLVLLPFAIITVFDLRRGQGQEFDYSVRQSDEWMEMKEGLRKIRKELNEIKAEGLR